MRTSEKGSAFSGAQKGHPIPGADSPVRNPSLVYPNPASGAFTVSSTGRFEYVITDQQGALVEKGIGENKTKVGLKLIPGVYFIKIFKGGSHEILKVIKR
ncbi:MULTISPECIES: T9SS type A sorting domain-containing protein [Niastella]|uniref:T9SS type A sorting domain-containing protein n=1 Tax=Niastella soli TaxID=2821487 RepID=A0ABS3Z112_9BACT|nr:T9SS type A sorting domain-containing protein [Niastella soli]